MILEYMNLETHSNFVHRFQPDWHARFGGNRREVQNGVGGAPKRHIHGECVVKRALGENLAGAQVFFHQVDNPHASLLGKADALGVYRRNRAAARKRHADGFRKARHGVCRKHA